MPGNNTTIPQDPNSSIQNLLNIYRSYEGIAKMFPGMTDPGASQELVDKNLLESINQQKSIAKAHYEVLKNVAPEKRLDYLRAYFLTNGTDAETFDSDPAYHAAHFMNNVFTDYIPNQKAARDMDLSYSDASLFFGTKRQ